MVKKSSSIILYFVCFAAIFFINTLWLLNPDFSTIVAVILISLVEALIPYAVIILITRIINNGRNPS